ncbi:MAG: hypothetical protein KDE27_17600 [Planctomycetes bacterium]|nr:hypothetical protein [Planctomycetota bacterium]
MLRSETARTIAICIGLATAALAQDEGAARWFVRAAAPGVRIAGAATIRVERAPDVPVETAPGAYEVHFPRDAGGKPDSLSLTVPAHATVAVAVEPAAAAESGTLASIGYRDYVVSTTFSCQDSAVATGLLARRSDDGNWYRFVWDRHDGRARLERALGGAVFVIAEASAPHGDDAEHELALQVEGFRLRAFLDDALVVQALDGAHVEGECAAWSGGDAEVRWGRLQIGRPAAPRASSAIAQTSSEAEFVAATCAAAGFHYVVELALDRPFALVPLTAAGIEPWLLHRPVTPVVVRADLRGTLGPGTFGTLGKDGHVRGRLLWPAVPAIVGQCATVRALVITPDGERLVSRTPSVPLAF